MGMTNLRPALLPLMLLACGTAGDPGGSCHVEETKAGARVWCDDGSEASLTDGQDGRDGADGKDGEPGQDGTNGADGETGPEGVPGERGADGDPAPATRVVESFSCGGRLEGRNQFTYDAVLWSSGDLLVTATVSSLATSASRTELFTPDQKGYETGPLSVDIDTDTTADGGWYDLLLDRTTLVTEVTYHSTSRALPEGTVLPKWTFQPTVCKHETY